MTATPGAIPALSADERRYGREARDRHRDADDPSSAGARAALETFYFAFNQRSAAALREVWMDDPLVQLNNPLGGILRGIEPIAELYTRVFDGPVRVWVELHDIVEMNLGSTFVFAGRERGEYASGTTATPLAIRTSRVFTFAQGSGWRQVHHHGSIDDSEALRRYQQAVRGVA